MPPDLSKLELGPVDFHRAMAVIVESKVENLYRDFPHLVGALFVPRLAVDNPWPCEHLYHIRRVDHAAPHV